MYRDAERKKQVAARIREAWEASGYTEEYVADAMGITISGFQKQKQTGGISRENLEVLAGLAKVDVEWITTGRGKGPTPDVMGSLNGDEPAGELQDQLARIEDKLDALLDIALSDETDPALEAARAVVAKAWRLARERSAQPPAVLQRRPAKH